MSFIYIISTVLIILAVRYMTGGGKGGKGAPAYTPDGMRVLHNPRLGNVALAIMGVLGLFMLFFGVLCFQDIGFGQGGVVFLFLLMGAGCIALGFFFKWLNGRNRVCFDERRVIQYRAIGTKTELEWWEITRYSLDPRKTWLAAIDGRKISLDYTYNGLDDLVQMIQQKVIPQ